MYINFVVKITSLSGHQRDEKVHMHNITQLMS